MEIFFCENAFLKEVMLSRLHTFMDCKNYKWSLSYMIFGMCELLKTWGLNQLNFPILVSFKKSVLLKIT